VAEEHADHYGDDVTEPRVRAHQGSDEVRHRILPLAKGDRLTEHHDEQDADKDRDQQGEDRAGINLQGFDSSTDSGGGAPARAGRSPDPRENARG